MVDDEDVEDILVVVAPDGGVDSGDGGFLPFEPEPESAQPATETGFIPAGPGTSSGSSSKNASGDGSDSTISIVIGVVAALVVGLAVLAFFLAKRQRKLSASAELVDKARADKIRREKDLATPTTSGANEDGVEVTDLGVVGAATAGTGGGGGWLSSKFRPKYLSPGKATKNRPDPKGQRAADSDVSSLGSSVASKESWAKRVKSNLSVGGSTLRGGDNASLGDDFSIGAESDLGGQAAGPAFTGDDVERSNILGEMGMDDDVDVTKDYDMNRVETAQSTWSFSGVGRKRVDPPAGGVNPPNYGVAVAPLVADDEETEFAPDTRILNDDESALLDDDFDREFNRKPSDLTHLSRGPGAIRSRQTGGSRYAGGTLPTHKEAMDSVRCSQHMLLLYFVRLLRPRAQAHTSSFVSHIIPPCHPHFQPAPPPPPAYSPPKKLSPTKLFAGSMIKRGPSLRQAAASQNQPTPSRANTAKAKTSTSYGYANKRNNSDDRGLGGSSTSPTESAGSGDGLTDVQRKRMEARKKMQMQMEYDAPSGAAPRHGASAGDPDTRYREIQQSYSTQSEATQRARNDNGETVLNDLNKLSGFLKERKEQQAVREGRGGPEQRNGSHRATSSSTSGGNGPKTVSSFMKDRGY